MNYLNGFKTKFLSTAFHLTKKTWVNNMLAMLMFIAGFIPIYIVMIIVMMSSVFDMAEFNTFAYTHSQPENFIADAFINNPFFNWNMLIMMLITYPIIFLLTSWLVNISMLFTKKSIKGEIYSFGSCLRESFNKNVFRILALQLTVLVSQIANIAIAFGVGYITNSIAIGIILFLLLIGLLFKYILIIPAFVIGDMKFTEAFKFSFSKMNILKCYKYYGISILCYFIVVISLMIIIIPMALIMFIPILGALIMFAFQIGMYISMHSFGMSVLSGLFVRNSTDEELTNNIIQVPDLPIE
jgi:hypothetical protein